MSKLVWAWLYTFPQAEGAHCIVCENKESLHPWVKVDQALGLCHRGNLGFYRLKGGLPVMAEITRILAANIRRQFFCYHNCSEYSLLGSKFSTSLLFAASKCHVIIQRQWLFKMFKMAERSDWLQWWNIAGSLYEEEGATEKEDLWPLLDRWCSRKYCMFSKSYSDRNSLIQLPLFERPARPMFIKLSYSCDDKKLFCELASTC